jgi:hypothetical protein
MINNWPRAPLARKREVSFWHLPAVTVSSSPHPLLRGELPRLDRAGPLGLTRRDRLEIEATFFGPHRLPVETERDDIFGSDQSSATSSFARIRFAITISCITFVETADSRG